ncbi:hypothetical protein ACFWOS_30070 [Streptomyces rubiginosohelvolus]|uniref:hypothetical protein n=1 Tax=Streptomyces rubiginosohelvolus TaxID=67362 RepID=UPI003664C304
MIVRIAREGQSAAAAREVRVARWLARENVPAVHLVDVEQPVEADGRPVTSSGLLARAEDATLGDVVGFSSSRSLLVSPLPSPA